MNQYRTTSHTDE